jgi:hypothetical protein
MPADASSAPDDGSTDDGTVRELSLEEFDPVGTLAVTGSYFLLLLVLYALMYFVEFAGRSPSIIE